MPNNFALNQLGVADYNQRFLDALEFVDRVIQKRQFLRTSVWRSMIPRGPYSLGEGLSKKSYRFHPGIGDQRGLQKWDAIQLSRVADGADQGFDACAYNPYLVDYGFQVVNYSGFMTSRRTKHICLRDIRFTWEFKQQLGLIMSFLADITNSVWENAAREQYIKFANTNSNLYVLSDGQPTSVQATYDPFSVDADGDNVITFASGNRVSNIDWSYMRWYLRWLQMQAPEAALANVNGKPLFGIVMDLEDIDKMIEGDAELREDYRYASPEVNIQNYGMVNAFKGYSLMHDVFAPRFAMKTSAGGTTTLKRIDPLIASNTTEGQRYDINPAYLNAEFAMGIIFMKDVFKFEIPPSGPAAPGGGTQFGSQPSLNGEFKWINIPSEDYNMLGENGFYFSRYEYFPKPMTYDEDAICFLYRRCPQSVYVECGVGGTDALASPQTASSATAVTGSTTLVTVVMAAIIDREAGETVNINPDAAGDIACVIADSSAAPSYVVACPTAANATTIAGATSNVVSW